MIFFLYLCKIHKTLTMKRILFLILALFASFYFTAAAQESEYTITKGGDKPVKVHWTVKKLSDGNTQLNIIFGCRKSIQVLDRNYRTLSWYLCDSDLDIDAKVVLKDGFYHITGKIKGKNIDRKEKSSGLPWYQNIGLSGGYVLKGANASVTYESVRPSNMEIYPMKSTFVEETTLNGLKVWDMKTSPNGVLSKLWSCHYYICTSTNGNRFIGYRGVEGAPGTEETVWTLTK